MFDNLVTVYRNSADVWFYVVGSQCDVRVQTWHDQSPAAAAAGRLPPRARRRSLSPRLDCRLTRAPRLSSGTRTS